MSLLDRKERVIATIIFILVVLLLIGDIFEDLKAGSSISHVTQEGLIVLLGLVGIMVLWSRYFSTRRGLNEVKRNLDQARIDLDHFKKETQSLTKGFSQKIDEQLKTWRLTKAEKQIALLIIKGLSNKEIAEIRSTSEKTIRQQASSIYQKANLSGRQELTAFFLEDLLVIS